MAQGSSDVEILKLLTPPFLPHNGEGNEGHESYGSNEGHESYEEEGSEQDCQVQKCKGRGLPWHQGKTLSGLTKADLIKNKNGKIVSKKKLAAGKKAFAHIKGWTTAVQKARKALGVKGFVAIKKGSALYKKAKELYQ